MPSAMYLAYLPVPHVWALFVGSGPLSSWPLISLTVGSTKVWSWRSQEDAGRDLRAAGLVLRPGQSAKVHSVVRADSIYRV